MTSNKHPYRQLLNSSVASICKENGFDGASKVSLETLTELLQAYLSELTRSCRKFCEHGYRTTPDLTDVKMALAEVGTSAHAVHVYCRRTKSQPLKSLNPAKPPVEYKTLKTSMNKVNQPSYIPNNFPEYPEVHAFVRTPALREPISQYETVRERVATQRVATEDSLIKFFSHTNPTEVHIFTNIDTDLYPSSGLQLEPYSYKKALLPCSNLDTMNSESNDEEMRNNNAETDSSSSQNDSSQNENPYLREPKRLKLRK